MHWKDEDLLDWVKRASPEWAVSTILSWKNSSFTSSSEIDISRFIINKVSRRADIDMKAVVGQHLHYCGNTWRDVLLSYPELRTRKLKDAVRNCDRNPDYYFAEPTVDRRFGADKAVCFTSTNGRKWYTNGEGNNRTVIAKFIHAMFEQKTGSSIKLRDVKTEQYYVDWETYEYYQQLTASIMENDLPIYMSVSNVSTADGNSRPLIKVIDDRFSVNAPSVPLAAAEFCRYADWVMNTKGKAGRYYSLLNRMRGCFYTDPRTIYYPRKTIRTNSQLGL